MSINLTREQTDDIVSLYWDTEIPPIEIIQAYGLANNFALLAIAGPAVLDGYVCDACKGEITVWSRTELTARLFYLNSGSRKKVMGPSLVYFYPTLCTDCAKVKYSQRYQSVVAKDDRMLQRMELLRTMPYRDYLQTEEWRRTRQSALKRASFACQICSSGGQLNVHHRTYIRRGAEAGSDLIVLCADCHRLFHDTGRLAKGGRADV